MPKHHRLVSDVCSYDSSSSEELYARIPRARHSRHGSVASSHHHHHDHLHQPAAYAGPAYAGPAYAAPAYAAPAYAGSSLAVPVVDVGGRKRASSTSGLPQPNIIINADGGSRSRSRERTRPRSRSRGRRYHDDDDMFEEIIERRGRISRSPSPYYRMDYETRKAMDKLKILEDEKADEEAQKKYKAAMEIKRAREQLEKAEAEEKRKEAAKKAIEDWQREEDAKKAKAKKEQEEVDKKVEEQLRGKLTRAGYSHSEIEKMLSKGEDDKAHRNEIILARHRPTYIKVHKKYLLPETLDAYQLPWSYDVSCLSVSNMTGLIFNAERHRLHPHQRICQR
jgi:hypothetical protein